MLHLWLKDVTQSSSWNNIYRMSFKIVKFWPMKSKTGKNWFWKSGSYPSNLQMHDVDADVKWKKSMIIVVQCCMLFKLLYPKTYLHPTSLLMQFTLINVMSAVTEACSVLYPRRSLLLLSMPEAVHVCTLKGRQIPEQSSNVNYCQCNISHL